MPGLAGAAASELHQVAVLRGRGDDLLRARGEDLVLRAGEVVLGELADLLEQRRSCRIVEEAARQRLRRGAQAALDLARQASALPLRRTLMEYVPAVPGLDRHAVG